MRSSIHNKFSILGEKKKENIFNSKEKEVIINSPKKDSTIVEREEKDDSLLLSGKINAGEEELDTRGEVDTRGELDAREEFDARGEKAE